MAYLSTLNLPLLLERRNIARANLAVRVGAVLGALLATGAALWLVWETHAAVTGAVGDLENSIAASKQNKESRKGPRSREQNYAAIAQRNVFGPLVVAAPPPQSIVPTPKPAALTPLSLVGTFIYAGEDPYAIIEDQRKHTQEPFLLNEMIFGEAKLVKIQPEYVEIERNGGKETLMLDDDTPGKPDVPGGGTTSDGDQFSVDEQELDRALENLPLLLTQARAVPYFADGKAVGLRLFAIKAGSLFEKIGLRNGDILKSVNGSSLADLSQAMQLFEKLKSERQITLSLERNREEKEFKYSIR